MMKKIQILLAVGLCLFLLTPFQLLAQEITVTGIVTDADGERIPGVNVLIRDTGSGTITNNDGEFEISIEADGVLVFSYIGFESKTVQVDGRTSLEITLQESLAELGEVVVLGYSERGMREISSSVVNIQGEDLQDITSPNTTRLLQGKAAGVFMSTASGSPGSTPDVRIRGAGSISANAAPLYVIDGVIAGSGSSFDVNTLNPRDIESITVLKDASATALYGSRAANGVIVVTTTQARPGTSNIDISSTVGVNRRTDGNFQVMNSAQNFEYHELMGNPNLDPSFLDTDTNWQDLAFDRGLTQEYQVSVSAGSELTSFYISGNYYNEEGTLISDNLERLAGRLNLTHQVDERVNLSASLSGSYTNEVNNPTGALYQSYTNLPWDRAFNEDGTIRTGSESGWLGRDQTNFLYPLQYNWSNNRRQYLAGSVRVEYNILDWLYASSSNRATLNAFRSESNADRRTPAGSTNNGELSNSYDYSTSFLTSNLLHANYDFDNHTISGIAGVEYQHLYSDGMSGTGIGIEPNLEILNVTAEPLSLGGYKNESTFFSVLSQMEYSYQNTYFLSLSYRLDGSSRFGIDNRYGNFYSIGGSWLLSNESFMDNFEAVDLLRLRASYGTTGNAGIGNYEHLGLFAYTVQYAGNPGAIPARTPNPELTWEVARQANLGLDFELFERFTISTDIYQQTNEDLLLAVVLPATAGFSSRTENVGSVRNRGLEVEISSNNIVTNNFSWTTDFNISFNRNRVLKLSDGDDILAGNQRIMEGSDKNTWYMRKWMGVDPENGDPLWEVLERDDDGNIISREVTSSYNDASLQPVGTASPDFTGGIRNRFRYGPVSLSSFFTFVSGNDIYHSARQLFDSDGGYPGYNQMVLQDGWSRWQQPGDDATHPRAVFGGNQNSNSPSSRYIEDGSYVRLQNVTLSYDVQPDLLNRIGLRALRLYASGDNLLTFTSFSGMDPEVGIETAIADTKYPISRKLLFGIEIGL
ncbi:MAG: TonB-dependent receptor [Balneolaceae bacterium]|nr:TonB-dependent receptor [Balneolaceae bacterium]